MNQYEPMREVSRDELIAEINKVALNPLGERSIGGDTETHCENFDDKECSPFRWDCSIDNARLCVGSKGVVELNVSTHGCNGQCVNNGGGSQLSYAWEWSKEKNSGYKSLAGNTNSLRFKLNMISWQPESGDNVWIRAKANCDDHPKNQELVGGSGGNGGQPIKVEIIDCCDGDQPCANDKECCNKTEHPDHPEGCQECCKNKHCEDNKACVNGKCIDKSCPDICQKWSDSFNTCVQKCAPGEICNPQTGDCETPSQDECTKDGDCTKGKKTKCCTKNGKKVCLECCGNGDCPDGKCENGVCVPNADPGPDPDPCPDPCQVWSESFNTCVQKCGPGEICDPNTGDCLTEPWQDPCEGVDCPEGEICEDGDCVADPDYDPCKDVDCPGASHCVDGDCVCDDPNAIIIGDVCVCDNGFEWDEENEICIPNGDPKPPPGDDPCGDSEDPCFGVICTPPQECDKETGKCVCPEGTELINGLCLNPDPCNGVLCPPNSECIKGLCTCLPGYVVDEKGNCVMAETPGCEPPEDCCPANSTVCIQAGSGLGGGGCFTLNQDCDKTIMLWVDPKAAGVDDDCDEHGMQQICACTKEIQALTDMITSLTARIAELEDTQGSVSS